jgi:hypothetical protein
MSCANSRLSSPLLCTLQVRNTRSYPPHAEHRRRQRDRAARSPATAPCPANGAVRQAQAGRSPVRFKHWDMGDLFDRVRVLLDICGVPSSNTQDAHRLDGDAYLYGLMTLSSFDALLLGPTVRDHWGPEGISGGLPGGWAGTEKCHGPPRKGSVALPAEPCIRQVFRVGVTWC